MKKEFVYDDITFFSRQISTIKSRFSNEIKLSTPVKFGNDVVDIGILMSAPMLDVSGTELCSFLNTQGHIGVMHRFMPTSEQVDMLQQIISKGSSHGVFSFSVGIHDCEEKLNALKPVLSELNGLKILICIDTANGSSILLEDPISTIKKFSQEIPEHNIEIMAGNIVTQEAAYWLYNQGVKFIRTGIGGGSVCTTPLATGIFRPVASAIMEINQWKIDSGIDDLYIVADGGIKGAADVMKALAVGADFVMLGSLFAGFDKSNGPLVEEAELKSESVDGTHFKVWHKNKYKLYRGMASSEMALLNNKVNGLSKKIIPEGVSSKIQYKGEFEIWFEEFTGFLRSSMSYCNAKTVLDFKTNVEIVEVTGAGNSLRQPHQLKK